MNYDKLPFKGFSPKAAKFFTDLASNNNREWFNANKETYESLIKTPSQELVNSMGQIFAKNGMKYVADPKKSLFKIYRDIRFSKDKSPYKTNMGVFFPYAMSLPKTQPVETPGIYFHLEGKETFIAGGQHMPSPNVLKSIRLRISEDWEMLNKIIKSKSFLKEFPEVFNDEQLKRMPLGFPADHPAESLLRLKGFTVYCKINMKDINSNHLLGLLEQKANALAPLNEFLVEALES